VAGEEEMLPEVGADTKVNSFKSALHVAHSLAQLQRELHSEWDDSVWSEEREAHGSKAQEYGRAWGLAARGHVNNSIKYYYVIFSIYHHHLKEVIVANGHPLLGDDSIQEINNKEMKAFKGSVFHCPYSREKVKVVKHMKVIREEEEEEEDEGEGESEYEERVSYRKPHQPVPAQVQRLKKLKGHVNRQRGYMGKWQKQSKGVQKALKLKVKKESARLLREGVVTELSRERAKL
jgi:hypothetical protein